MNKHVVNIIFQTVMYICDKIILKFNVDHFLCISSFLCSRTFGSWKENILLQKTARFIIRPLDRFNTKIPTQILTILLHNPTRFDHTMEAVI